MKRATLRVDRLDGGRSAFYLFGLIVTGETEERCLPSLLRILAAQGPCSFKLIRRVGQRSPRSARRVRKMVGSGKTIPDRDAEEIGLPARNFLKASASRYVLLVDDLEANRAADIENVFGRYRSALDTMLGSLAPRAAVHFFVNMLEAYYLADAAAVNQVLGTDVDDHDGDVEEIHNPKARLKSLYPVFDEKEHGAQIVERLDVLHVLARPDACASLRTLFAWASEAIGESDWLPAGRLSPTTEGQIGTLREHLATHG